MRNALAALVVVAAAGLAASGADEKYTSKEGKFTARFPSDLTVKTEAKKAGAIEMQVASAKDDKENSFTVMYVDLPAAAKAPPKAVLDGIEAGMVSKSGCKVESTKEITYGAAKYPGREVLVDKDGAKIKTRIILAESRVYIVFAGGPKGFGATDAATKFLDSFETK
ncbi:hypothetical protein GobsT_38890 [Gemmata obscuriglobus]|nr:hypothetical protein [Gemmata obscuriglobus]QEG29100.1 hypothetical protein GobsT_38890 [Gemmata obscuriglobus]VTS07775.1 Uncharacterized protein OS=Oscillatoriales cyanobacterium JSC-12 GN=OsccyDRAFT_2220 PE=4 SV=1 [Gemmata obscuriglobus UQM 2246]